MEETELQMCTLSPGSIKASGPEEQGIFHIVSGKHNENEDSKQALHFAKPVSLSPYFLKKKSTASVDKN